MRVSEEAPGTKNLLATRLDDQFGFHQGIDCKLRGDRTGQYAIATNDRWRICFRFADGDAYDVEITDYH